MSTPWRIGAANRLAALLLPALAHSACGDAPSMSAGPSTAGPTAGTVASPTGAAGAAPAQPSPQVDAGPSAAGSSGAGGVAGASPQAGGDASTPDAAPTPGDGGTTADAAVPPEPVTCPTPALPPGNHDGSVSSEGHDRTYVVHVPSNYTGDEPVPLVFDFHGYGSSGAGQMGASGFRELSDEHGFVAVYPDGVGGSWHVNGCCGQAAQEQLDEVAAVRAILAEVSARVCVDRRRIYASGISQGGGMAHHVGCLAADTFAAVAPVSSDLRTDPCAPARPISELSFRGTADTLSRYEGGPVGPAGMQYQSIGAQATLERWAMIDECSGTPETTLEVCESYTQCAAGVEVTLCSIPGGSHVLYSNPSNFDVAAAAWAMFERQQP